MRWWVAGEPVVVLFVLPVGLICVVPPTTAILVEELHHQEVLLLLHHRLILVVTTQHLMYELCMMLIVTVNLTMDPATIFKVLQVPVGGVTEQWVVSCFRKMAVVALPKHHFTIVVRHIPMQDGVLYKMVVSLEARYFLVLSPAGIG
jgi:hypothetical protein